MTALINLLLIEMICYKTFCGVNNQHKKMIHAGKQILIIFYQMQITNELFVLK